MQAPSRPYEPSISEISDFRISARMESRRAATCSRMGIFSTMPSSITTRLILSRSTISPSQTRRLGTPPSLSSLGLPLRAVPVSEETQRCSTCPATACVSCRRSAGTPLPRRSAHRFIRSQHEHSCDSLGPLHPRRCPLLCLGDGPCHSPVGWNSPCARGD